MSQWSVRLLAAAILTVCCTLAGRALCYRERRRVEFLQSLIRALPMLKIDMLERMAPLRSALSAGGQLLLTRISEAMGRGMGAREAWLFEKDALCARGAMLDSLVREDLLQLDILFEGIGASGQSRQRLLLEETEKALALQLEAARKRADERGRLYTNLGLLLGLAISVCLL